MFKLKFSHFRFLKYYFRVRISFQLPYYLFRINTMKYLPCTLTSNCWKNCTSAVGMLFLHHQQCLLFKSLSFSVRTANPTQRGGQVAAIIRKWDQEKSLQDSYSQCYFSVGPCISPYGFQLIFSWAGCWLHLIHKSHLTQLLVTSTKMFPLSFLSPGTAFVASYRARVRKCTLWWIQSTENAL